MGALPCALPNEKRVKKNYDRHAMWIPLQRDLPVVCGHPIATVGLGSSRRPWIVTYASCFGSVAVMRRLSSFLIFGGKTFV